MELHCILQMGPASCSAGAVILHGPAPAAKPLLAIAQQRHIVLQSPSARSAHLLELDLSGASCSLHETLLMRQQPFDKKAWLSWMIHDTHAIGLTSFDPVICQSAWLQSLHGSYLTTLQCCHIQQ